MTGNTTIYVQFSNQEWFLPHKRQLEIRGASFLIMDTGMGALFAFSMRAPGCPAMHGAILPNKLSPANATEPTEMCAEFCLSLSCIQPGSK